MIFYRPDSRGWWRHRYIKLFLSEGGCYALEFRGRTFVKRLCPRIFVYLLCPEFQGRTFFIVTCGLTVSTPGSENVIGSPCGLQSVRMHYIAVHTACNVVHPEVICNPCLVFIRTLLFLCFCYAPKRPSLFSYMCPHKKNPQ